MRNKGIVKTVSALFGLLTLGAALAQGYEYAQAAQAPAAPSELALPSGYRLMGKVLASGVQIYACAAKADKTGYEWALKAPDAVLTDEKGTKVGTHYGGPSWEALDGSKLTGEVKARYNSPDAGAIPWLLLATKSAGKEGAYSKVAYIHRLETAGGKAPADGCAQATLGQETRVGYTATYYMYEAAPY